jgi:transcriptional regulator of NAD metabolism
MHAVDTIERDELLCVLARHVGAENGASARELVSEITHLRSNPIAERRLRILVQRLRMEGSHICAHPAHGYFMASDEDELQETCEFLRHRALTSLAQLSAMTHTSIPDLIGQMRFTT